MMEACGVKFMDRDWVSASRARACMQAYASFEHVVNFTLPRGSLLCEDRCSEPRYCQDEYGAMVREAFVWIGSKSCDFAPGGLVLDVQKLPAFFHNARSLCITEREAGCYEISIVDDRKQGHRLQARAHATTAYGSLLESMPVGPHALPAKPVIQSVREALHVYGATQSPFTGECTEALFDTRMSDRLVADGLRFCELVASDAVSPRAVFSVLSRLVGLGIGLTPSGDDFIIGALAIKKAFSLPKAFDEELIGIIDALSCKTTKISQHYLMSAVRGRFSKNVIDVVKLILNGENRSGADESVSKYRALLSHGSTSGTDTLAGITAMLLAYSKC